MRVILAVFLFFLNFFAIAQEKNEDKINRLENDLKILQKYVYSNQAEGNMSTASRTASAYTLSQIDEIREQIKKLVGDIENLQFENSSFQEKLVKLSSDLELKINNLSKDINKETVIDKTLKDIANQLDQDLRYRGGGDSRSAGDSQDKESSINNDPKTQQMIEEEYINAHSLLKSKMYKKAQMAFRNFIKKYPHSDFIGNAYYWLGETLFLTNEFEKAGLEYLRGYQKDPRGSRGPDNLLKLGMSLLNAGKGKEACTTFFKLQRDFPNASNIIKIQLEKQLKIAKCHKLMMR